MNWLRKVLQDLGTPDAQRNDWYGWSTNQLGHISVGLFGCWVLLFSGVGAAAAVGAILCGMLLKEISDLRKQHGRAVRDSATDFAFVAFGCAFALSQHAVLPLAFFAVLGSAALLLLVGIRKRVLAETKTG